MTYEIQIQFFFDGDSGQFSNGERFRLADVRSPDKDEVDYIISTVPIKDRKIKSKTLQVNAILTDKDKANLISFMGLVNPTKNEVSVSERILQDITDYLPADKINEVRKIILNRISNGNKKITVETEGKKTYMLNDLIKRDKILFANSVKTWEDAIWLSAKPLLDDNTIENRYCDKVISNVNELGPYICIAPHIAISHARPQDGANGLGMTILVLEEPAYFDKNNMERPTRVIVTLAAPDNEQHLLALQQLSRLLMEDLDNLLTATSEDQILKLVQKYSE